MVTPTFLYTTPTFLPTGFAGDRRDPRVVTFSEPASEPDGRPKRGLVASQRVAGTTDSRRLTRGGSGNTNGQVDRTGSVRANVAAKKATTKKAASKSAASSKSEAKNPASAKAGAGNKKAAGKKAASETASTKAKKAATKKSVSKNQATTKKATKTVAKKSASTTTREIPASAKYLADDAWLAGQRQKLLEERAKYTSSADRLAAEAAALMADREPGDVQFDEESGEGDTIAVERDRDLALSAAARQAVDDIDRALERLDNNTYGFCVAGDDIIPKERLEAIPEASVCVEHKTSMF